MADDNFAEKTEPATPKRRAELRRDGKVVKSMEVNSALGLLGGSIILYMLGRGLIGEISDVMKQYLSLSYGMDLSPTNAITIAGSMASRFLLIVFPVLLVIMGIGILSNVAQVGFLFTTKPLAKGFSGMNPLNGIKKLGLSQSSLIELTKSIFKILIVSVIGYFALNDLIEGSIHLVESSPVQILSSMGTGAFAVTMKIAAVFLVMALTDFIVQRRKFERDTRMSKQEIKEENKRDEGDPQIKGRIRREMVKRHKIRMMANVPKADVVVTNPTHYAIAIKYDAAKMSAPLVVAKGKDLIAQRIKEIAVEHNIPIVEDRPLAQLLYKTVEVDEQIPPDLFKAVAQILAYIYKMKKLKRGYGKN